ncbi:MAG: serine hydrolase, partial [Anaerolineae bacterium]
MEELNVALERAASETEFSGVVSVFRGASTIYNKAYGYRDIKNRLPNTTSTIFGIASGTKIFTALGIGVLIDQGVLSLDTINAIPNIAQKTFQQLRVTGHLVPYLVTIPKGHVEHLAKVLPFAQLLIHLD